MDEYSAGNISAETITDSAQAGSDLIDATQSVIIDAAENVSEVLDKVNPAVLKQTEEIPFYADVEFWVGMAFILTLIILAKPGIKFLKKAMRNKISSVASQIDEAQKVRDDAQKLLAEYENKFRNTDKEISRIISETEKSIASQKNSELSRMKEQTALYEKEARRRISASAQKARDEINASLSKEVIKLAKDSINAYVSKNEKSKLLEEAINELDKFLA